MSNAEKVKELKAEIKELEAKIKKKDARIIELSRNCNIASANVGRAIQTYQGPLNEINREISKNADATKTIEKVREILKNFGIKPAPPNGSATN